MRIQDDEIQNDLLGEQIDLGCIERLGAALTHVPDVPHVATYHGGEYTPTANDIREVWGGFSEYGGLVIRPSGTATFLDDRYAEFDRWLETVRAEAKAEALRDAADEVLGYDPRVSLRGIYAALKFRANQYKEQS